mmetsp:Transcript_48781/g.109535  ORF Transcript_48781/g.109535 Transcript_48781/m.109535 type:complete len:82 (+) Transcript_48781:60-305(+)
MVGWSPTEYLKTCKICRRFSEPHRMGSSSIPPHVEHKRSKRSRGKLFLVEGVCLLAFGYVLILLVPNVPMRGSRVTHVHAE